MTDIQDFVEPNFSIIGEFILFEGHSIDVIFNSQKIENSNSRNVCIHFTRF